jgi:hypothetical protein
MHAILCTAREQKAAKRAEWDGLAVRPRYKFDALPSSGGPQILTPALLLPLSRHLDQGTGA